MFYIVINWKIKDSSNLYLENENWETIEKDFTENELLKIQKWYNYNIKTWIFEESEESLAFELKQKQNKKLEIITKLWNLDIEKRWLELLGEDLTEINLEIDNLKIEFNNLK